MMASLDTHYSNCISSLAFFQVKNHPRGAECASLAQTGGTCIPVAERKTENGCFVHAEERLEKLSRAPIFWHIDRFPSRSAAEAAKEKNGTVVQIFGHVWLFTIADESWRSSGGEHVASVGPLELPAARESMAT
ncbi:hypothetical protein [Caballeronia grimmiae]|uniref:hypothetical protein n=1 Tax=Caballeronia grimmiae TaxID=1071679 RepID=UPI0038BB7020